MKSSARPHQRAIVVAALAVASIASIPGQSRSTDWPQFRGPGATGVAPAGNPPAQWNLATSKNVAWQTAIPGLAHASPIVWGDRIFVVTAVASSGTPTVLTGDSDKAGIDPANDMVSHTWRLLALGYPAGGRPIYAIRPGGAGEIQASACERADS